MVAHADVTELFGQELEDLPCQLAFAARCRAWAKTTFAQQQERQAGECFVEIDDVDGICRKGDRVLFVSGPEGLRGSTGVVSSGLVPFSTSKFIHVDVTPQTSAGAERSPVTGPGRNKLELQISAIFDSHDSHR